MTIAPIVRSVTVKVPPARAFDLFARDVGRWWLPAMHIGTEPLETVVIEPREGGRWYERAASGAESDWGVVLAWDPPHRLLLGWKINAAFRYDPDFLTEVEVDFEAEGAGTRVTLTHRKLEAYGASGAEHAAKLDSGWPRLVAAYAEFASQETDA